MNNLLLTTIRLLTAARAYGISDTQFSELVATSTDVDHLEELLDTAITKLHTVAKKGAPPAPKQFSQTTTSYKVCCLDKTIVVMDLLAVDVAFVEADTITLEWPSSTVSFTTSSNEDLAGHRVGPKVFAELSEFLTR